MRAATSKSYMPSSFDHQKMLNDGFFAGRYDHSSVMNENSVAPSSPDMLGIRDLRNALVNPSRHPAPSMLNMTPEKTYHQVNTDSCGSESPYIMNFSDKTNRLGLEICGLNIRDSRTPKLMLDLSRVRNNSIGNMVSNNRNNGSSPPFSDSSLSTSSSNLDMGFFSHSVQTGRSDSPNSEASNSSAESTSHHTNNFTFPQLTDQELANLQNLHLINCMSNLSKDQFMQTINMLHSVFQMQQISPLPENETLETEARFHRTAAVSGNVEAQFTWSGKLPKRSHGDGPYSTKVFLGGVPWDITEDLLTYSFQQFGNVKVEWPGKDSVAPPKGYAYIIFENELHVKLLLESCREGTDGNEGSYFFKIPSRKSKPKEVQVIPWAIEDSNYSVKTFQKLDPLKTVFVGALHGMMNAEGLFQVMNDLFGGVLYAGIDTDKNKYPIGSGRVTFNNYKSYVRAVTAAFVDIKTPKFVKKVQLDPYLEDTPCSMCHIALGPFFCRENGCFRYFCTGCWGSHHTPLRLSHKPLSRNSKHGSMTNATNVSPH